MVWMLYVLGVANKTRQKLPQKYSNMDKKTELFKSTPCSNVPPFPLLLRYCNKRECMEGDN